MENQKRRKKLVGIYWSVLGISLILVVLAFVFARPHRHAVLPDESPLAGEVTQLDENTREVRLHPVPGGGDSVMFYCNHSRVQAWADGELVYSVEGGDTVFGRTSGGFYHFIPIQPDTRELVVQVEAIYPQVRAYLLDFYQGNGVRMYDELMRLSVPKVFVCIVDLTISISLLLFFALGRRKLQIKKGAVWFGLFGTLVSLWTLNSSTWMVLMIRNRVATSFMEYVLLMLIPPTVALYIRDVTGNEGEKAPVAHGLLLISCANVLALVTLHLCGVAQFKETATSTHVVMVAVLIYAFYRLIRQAIQKGMAREQCISLLCLCLLSVFFFQDLFAFYFGQMADIFGWLGVAVCLMAMGINVFASLVSDASEAQKAQFYKEMAIRDLASGLLNRNSYNHWLEKGPGNGETFMVTFDLNDLKRCNDTLGHLMGDQYIRDAANLVKRVFDPAGCCYRMGGDEFLAVVQGKPEGWVQRKLAQLDDEMAAYNQASEKIHMEIAYGYARFDPNRDRDCEDTRQRADLQMYARKKALKSHSAAQ